jgi:Domain of unknown function (DUF1707)
MSENYSPLRQQDDGGLRAGDRDRGKAADILREQHVAGRLETDEFQERLDRCYAAKTYAELDELLADLPRQEQPRPVQRARRWPVMVFAPLLIVAIAVSHGRMIWLALPLLLFVVRPLAAHSVRPWRGFP